MSRLKAVLFDADGVVINKKHLFSEVYVKEFGIPMATLLDFFDGEFQSCLTGQADLKELLTPARLKQWQWSGSADELLAYWFKSEHGINDKIVAHIQELRAKGIICALATNNEKHRTGYITNEMGLGHIFDTVYSSSGLTYKKPDPKFYQAILADLGGLSANEVLFWDDDPENIRSAKQIGMPAEVYTSFPLYKQRMNTLL